jgi:hypothetical protein
MDPPRLDHVSLRAPAGALADLGFRLTPTRGSSTHSRIFLDRHYIEVDETGAIGIEARSWFLGADDLNRAATALAAAVVPTLWPTRHQGHDGVWEDVAVVARSASIPMLTRRIDLGREAWPPPIEEPHPNRVTALSELRLRSDEPGLLAAYLTTMEAAALGDGRFRLAAGIGVAIEDGDGPDGIVDLVFRREGADPLVLSLS